MAEYKNIFEKAVTSAIPVSPKLPGLSGAISLGIAGAKKATSATWFCFKITDGKISLQEVKELAIDPRLTHEPGVDVAILAASSKWITAGNGGREVFFELIQSLDFDISGSLACFIRHLTSIVALILWFAAIVAAPPQ